MELLIIVIFILLSIFKNKINKLIYNEMIWITFWWWLPIVLYYGTGIRWFAYKESPKAIVYYIVAYVLFGSTRAFALKFKFKNRYKIIKKRDNEIINDKKVDKFFIIGFIGTLIYVVDYLMHNSIMKKSRYSVLSIWGTLGSFFCPLLLTIGLYWFAKELKCNKKISKKALFSLGLYLLPNTLNSGREGLLVVFVGVFVIYSILTPEGNIKKSKSDYKKRTVFGVVVSFIIVFMLNISNYRFGNLESNALLLRAVIPTNILNIINHVKIGKNMLYNILSYYAQQMPYFSFVYDNYEGPLYMGLYEFNIISRRLPRSMFYNGDNILTRVRNFVPTAFATGWPTGMASLIYDFGKMGALIMISLMGFYVGRRRADFIKTESLRSIVVIALFCSFSMSLIQNGVFFQYIQFGAFMWWIILF